MSSIDVLISKEDLDKRVSALAKEINKDYDGKPVILMCVLKGGVIFMVDLAKKLEMDLSFDFMDVSSYGSGTESSGIIKVNMDLSQSITGKDVLLVEDIIDTGRTLSHIKTHLLNKKPASLKICALLDKPSRRVVYNAEPDYTGFVIPDEFVIGYGLDYDQKYRNLPYIGVIRT